MRNRQLKESLLGWGGYDNLQEKIYLEDRVVYLRGNRSQSTSTLHNTLHKWSAVVGGNTYLCYTEQSEPKLGDVVFLSGTMSSGVGRVLSYDSLTNQIQIYMPASYNYPSFSTNYDYVEGGVSLTTTVNLTTEYLYLVNIDGTPNNKKYDISIDYNDTISNEKFFFDKRTQCLIRTAFQEYPVYSYSTSNIGTLKQIVFDAFDPNLGILLDHHVYWARSNQSLEDHCRKENISQGFYSFYCNGIIEKATASTSGFAHSPSVYTYSPRHRKVFVIPVGDVIDIQNPIGTDAVPTKDVFFGIYNQSSNLDKLDDIIASFYIPSYIDDTTDNVNERFVYIDLNMETNPVSMVPGTVLTINSNVPGNVVYTNEKYLNTPASSLNIGFGNNSNNINKMLIYNNMYNNDHEFPYEFYTYNVSSSYHDLCMPDTNMCANISYSMIYPIISSTGWDGQMRVLFPSYRTYLLTTSQLSTLVTNTALYPRIFSGSKYINQLSEVTNSGELCRLGSKIFYKVYSDTCYGALIITCSTLPQITAILIGETEESVMYYDNNNTTPRIGGYIDYNGKRWYYGCGDLSGNNNIVNTQNLNYIYTETLDITKTETIAFYAIKCIEEQLYTNATVVKDYYNDGTNQLVYKLYSMGKFTPIKVYDSVTGNETSYIQREQPEIPFSENYMVFTSTSQVSEPDLPRYVNVVSIDQDNTPDYYTMKTTTVKVDCNSNTNYLSDNTSTGVSSSGFAIPPVAVGDGELIPVPEPINMHYYAWKNVTGSSTKYIFTNSLDAGVVVGKAYYFNDGTNNFYREVEGISTIVTSITNSYLTTQDGTEYTRVNEYDWDYEEATESYIPSYLNAWGA